MTDELKLDELETIGMFCRLNMNTRKNLPVRSSEMGLLILVVTSSDDVTPLYAANFFKVKKPMITSMVGSMVKGGYITKVPSLSDKRSYTIVATDKAKELVLNTREEYTKSIELLKSGLGSDYDMLVRLLAKSNKILIKEKENE